MGYSKEDYIEFNENGLKGSIHKEEFKQMEEFLEKIKKAKEKKFIIDLAQLPVSEEFPIEKWMEYFNELNIKFTEQSK